MPISSTSEQKKNPLPPERVRYLQNRLLGYARRRFWGWVIAISGVILSTIILMAVIWLFSPLLDIALPTRDLRLAGQLLLAMVGLTLVGNLINRQANAYIARLAQDLMVDLRTDYAANLLRQGQAFYHRHDLGELMSIGMKDAETISEFFMDEVASLLNYLAQFIVALASMLYKSVPLAIGSALFSGVVYSLSLGYLVPRSRRLAAAYSQQFARVNGALAETLGGVRDIQIFSQQERLARHFQNKLKKLGNYLVGQRNMSYWNTTIFYMIDGLSQALIYGVGVLAAIAGLIQFTSGQLVSFVGLFANFNSPIRALGNAALVVQSMLIAADRVFNIMDTPPAITDQPGARDPGRLTGHIQFENVRFAYTPDDLKSWKLDHINLEIMPGEKVAFVGGSGSGKSTVLNLVARFYDATSGRVLIDGMDVREMQLNALRRNFGLVAQNVILFEGSLADNIRFARPDADQAAVERAAQIGYVTEFLAKLPHGYHTPLDGSGGDLSGGQKQRVSIARAALADPAIFLLDEATSALDTESEAAVTKTLDDLTRDRTTLVVTHRLNTIRNADKIVVLGADKFGQSVVKAVGTHDDLMEKSPDYIKLYGQIKKKSILLPIGPRYDTSAALPTVIGLAQAYNAPVYLLDFGQLPADEEAQKNFGITIIPGLDTVSLNVAHALRVERIQKDLTGEGLTVKVVHPRNTTLNWVEATIAAVNDTEVSHLVAVDNMLVPLDKLRESIRMIERKGAVEYIMVNPIAGVG